MSCQPPGDFRQVLPILKSGDRASTVAASITRSPLWKFFEVLHFTENMRVKSCATAGEDPTALQNYASWLLNIGNGLLNSADNELLLPEHLCMPPASSLSTFLNWVLPDLANNLTNPTWIAERAILAPHHCDVDDLNSSIIADIPGDAWDLYSADSAAKDENVLNVPTELLNSLNPAGLQKHHLVLKPNMPVMLIRNLNANRGLCNGTRLLVRSVRNNRILEADIITPGPFFLTTVFIPRITLSPEEGTFPFNWSRRQFPVNASFAMTVNKSQGQTLKCAGIYLRKDCFSHGQFYVACSRVGNPRFLRIFQPADEGTMAGTTSVQNVVYKEALAYD